MGVMAEEPPVAAAPAWYELRTRHRCGPMAVHLACRITAHGVVEWCDRYAVRPVTHSEHGGEARLYEGTEGPLPADPAAKHDAIEDTYAWIARTRGSPFMGIVQLYRGGEAILWDDGVLSLHLTPVEFAVVQNHWAAFGLPRDLCYRRGPDGDPNTLDAVDWGDSPEDLARHRRAFVRESGRYLAALSVRETSLRQEWPGDEEEGRTVEELNTAVGRAMLRAIRLIGDWRGDASPDD